MATPEATIADTTSPITGRSRRTTARRNASMAGLEVVVSALVRWSESKHIRSAVTQMSGCDIAPSLMRLLEHFDLSGPMRVGEIALCLGIDVSTASLQSRPLKQDELVTRTPDPLDRRISMISITVKGRDVVARVRAARQELLAEAFTQTSAEEIEQAVATPRQVRALMSLSGTPTRSGG